MRRIHPYFAAILVTAAATAARASLTSLLGTRFPLLTYWPAVELIAYFFGFRPAMFAIGLSILCGRLFFMQQRQHFLFPSPGEVASACMFTLFTASVAMFMESLRRSREEAKTSAKLAEERLKVLSVEVEARRRERYWAESVLSSIGDGVIAANREGSVTYLNDVASGLTGWTKLEAASQAVNRVFYTVEDNPHPLLSSTDGRMIPIERNVSKILDTHGEDVGRVFVFRDVTDRRKAQANLETSEKRLHASLKAASSAAWEWNSDTHEILCAKEFRELTGARTTAGYLNFDAWMQSVHQDDRPQLEAELKSASQRGAEFRLEHRCWRDGEVRWLALLGNVSSPGRIMGIVVDITERRRMEDKLRNAAKQESLGVLSAGIAHDFNNLLTSILGHASLLRDELPPDSQAADFARNIEISSERAAHLTRQILAYSGQGRFAVEKIDLAEHLRQCLNDLSRSINDNIRLKVQLEPGLPRIQADSRQVEQVITNIVTNAVEAIGVDPGCIHVIAASRSLSQYDFPGEDVRAGGYVLFEVQDDGPGMDEATRAKIFDPFFTTKFMGRGLGLAAVMGIVRGHGGAIRLASQPGEGTSFQIFWPVASE